MGEPVDDVNNRIAAFRDETAIFCALVEEMRQGRPQDLYARLMRSMTRLAYLVEELPGDLAWNADDDDGPRMNTEDWMALFRQVGAVVEPDVSGLTVVFGQTGQEHDAAQALRLADDLVDVYRDLYNGLAVYCAGKPDALLRAAWRWRFRYELH